jgi:hypothetical protein
VSERSGHVSRATIYGPSVCSKNAASAKVLFGHSRHFYESVVGRHHHDHLVCIRCGQIREFEEDKIEDLQEEICRRFGYAIVDAYTKSSASVQVPTERTALTLRAACGIRLLGCAAVGRPRRQDAFSRSPSFSAIS